MSPGHRFIKNPQRYGEWKPGATKGMIKYKK